MNENVKNILSALSAPVCFILLQILMAHAGLHSSDLWACAACMLTAAVLYYAGIVPVNEGKPASMHIRQAVVSLAIGFAYTAALVLLIEALPASWKWKEAVEEPASVVMRGISVPYFITLFIALPAAEEFCFRHILFGELCEHYPLPAAVLVSTALYGFLFFLRDGLYGCAAGVLTGILFCLIYDFTTSMWACVSAHIGSSIGLLMSYVSVFFSQPVLLIIALSMLAASFFLLLHLAHMEDEELLKDVQSCDQDEEKQNP